MFDQEIWFLQPEEDNPGWDERSEWSEDLQDDAPDDDSGCDTE